MKKTVVVCDHCGETVKGFATPLALEFEKAMACAEDDATYTENFDLCETCSGGLLLSVVGHLGKDEYRGLGKRLLQRRGEIAARRS